MSEKDYKRKAELMFKKNSILINELEQAKEIIRELLSYDIILIDATRKFEYMDLQKKAESFLDARS